MNDRMDELLNGCADKDDLSWRVDGWMDDTPRNPLVKGNFSSIFPNTKRTLKITLSGWSIQRSVVQSSTNRQRGVKLKSREKL